MNNNKQLNTARKRNADEFHTQMMDVIEYVMPYKNKFAGKSVLCNCDDPDKSNFFKFFVDHFDEFKLRKVSAACYKSQQIVMGMPHPKPSILAEYTSKGMKRTPLKINGSFDSLEMIKHMQAADIVVTNPPFSLMQPYYKQLLESGKKFLIIGHQIALTYKEVFQSIVSGKVTVYPFRTGAAHFLTNYPDTAASGHHITGQVRVSGVCWFTNFEVERQFMPVVGYHPDPFFPKYDDYDAYEVGRVKLTASASFDKTMGVPITFLFKYHPKQFDILGLVVPVLNGKKKFRRVLIKHKQ